MRRSILVVCLMAVVLLVPTSAGAQTTTQVTATFTGHTPKPNLAERPIALCGAGQFGSFGQATFTIIPVSVTTTSRSCADATAIGIVTLIDGSGTLQFELNGQICFPGNSSNAPGQSGSYGNPFRASGTVTVTGGTGAFAGATGGGTGQLRSAGAHMSGSLDVALTLP